MPLIKNFKSTTIWKAFILNSIVSTLVIILAITIKDRMDKYTDKKGKKITRTTDLKILGATILVTFSATLMAYILMYITVGYGGGMLTND